MTRACLSACLCLTCLAVASSALADGGFFFRTGETVDLAQTKQEVLIAFHTCAGSPSAPYVTYVLRSRYSGEPGALAWVIPVPNTPINVVAHDSDTLFDNLDQLTRPTFMISDPTRGRGGFGCGCAADLAGTTENSLVVVEARGQAGIFEWAALTSTGGTALLTWLNTNGFAVPATALGILNSYINNDWHFLAIRVREPDAVTQSDGEIEIPPIQYCCQTRQRVYPMAISQVSAASQIEVLIYVLAEHRAAAENLANATIDLTAVTYDATSASETNYESLFTQTIAANNGRALITEFAGSFSTASLDYGSTATDWVDHLNWQNAPAPVANLTFLTRLRTVIARENMDLDFQFEDAATDQAVVSMFGVTVPTTTADAATLVGPGAAALLAYGLLGRFVKRFVRRRSA